MSWRNAFAAWVLFILAESVQGLIRRLFVVPAIGDLAARQIGVLVGSTIALAVALLSIGRIGARTPAQQIGVGLLWVVLTASFELCLGAALGYSRERILSDYDLRRGGWMAFAMLFLLFTPFLAQRLRAANRADSR